MGARNISQAVTSPGKRFPLVGNEKDQFIEGKGKKNTIGPCPLSAQIAKEKGQ